MSAWGHPAPAGPPLALLRQPGQLGAIERDWKRLYRMQARPNPFLSWEWQRAWLEAHPRGVEPWIAAASFADGSLAGLLALQRVRRRGLRQLEFLSQGSGGDEMDCLLHPEAGAAVAGRLVEAALGAGGWDLARLESARPGGALAAAIAAAAGGGPEVARPGEWMPYLPLPGGDFETFLRGQSANFRSEVRRRRRNFARVAPAAAVECAETPGALAAGLDHLFRLHNLRRAQKRGRGIFESAALREFHLRAAAALGAGRAARVYLLRAPEAVVAALYGLSAGGRFLYFQSGFDPGWTAVSPGTVLLSSVVEDCIRRGEEQFEFLRGDESYKARWSSRRRRSVHLRLARGAAGRSWEWLGERWRRRRGRGAEEADGGMPLAEETEP